MDLTPYLENLRRDLLQAAALGDDSVRQTANALAGALDASARLTLMNAFADLADEINTQLDGAVVDVRLDGKDVRIHVEHLDTDDEPAAGPFSGRMSKEPGADDADGRGGFDTSDWAQAMKEASRDLSRTTVRLFNDLKTQAENAAAQQGVSLNTYISRAVHDSVRGAKQGRDQGKRPGRGGRNMSGWIQG